MKIVEVKGPDSADFLHRVTAGSVKLLGAGQGKAGCLLTGRSLMRAQFDLLRLAPDRFFLVAPDSCAAPLAEGLEALQFSENLEIRLTGLAAGVAKSGAKAREQESPFSVNGEGEELRWPAPVAGYEFVCGSGASPEGEWPASWEFDRIAALLPWSRDWAESTPALEAGMLPFIDRHKGCYPGQEVVELSLNVGHPARVLISVECAEPFKETMSWNGAEARVTSSASQGGRHVALLRVPWAGKDFLPPGCNLLKSHW